MKARWTSWLKWAALLAGVLLAARALAHFPWSGVWQALAGANVGWIALSAILLVLSLLAKGAGWHLLMTGGSRKGLMESLRAHMLGAAAMTITVSVGAEAVRIGAIVPRLGIPARRAVAAAAWSRVAEAIALILMLLPASLVTMPASLRHLRLPAAALSVAAMVAVALLLLPALRERLLLPALLARFPERWRDRMGEAAAIGLDRRMVGPLALALLNWLFQWGAYGAGILAVGIQAPPIAWLAVIIAVNLGGLLHLTPGNVGVLQAGCVFMLGPFGVTAAAALAAGLLLQAVQTLPPLLIGAVLLGSPWRAWGVIRDIKQEVEEEPERHGASIRPGNSASSS